MKFFLSILFFFIYSSVLAISGTKYYLKSGGNNSLSGTSIANAWATLVKVNSFAGFSQNDTIFLEGGSTFVGPLIPPHNGIAGQPIVITSYGTGKATITGFTTLSSWANLGGNIWECTPSVTLKPLCNILTFNTVPQQLGRTPNSTFNTYSSATTTQLVSSTNISATSYVGAEVVMRCNTFVMQRMSITAQSGNTLTYTRTAQAMDNGNAQGAQSGTPNYGYFLQRFAGSLDQQGEWYYNPSTQKMRIYSTTNPNSATIKASYIDTLIVLGSRSYITLDNLAIEGAGIYAVYGNVSSTGNLIVKNCTFNNNTRSVYLWNCFASVVRNNTVNNSFNVGIMVVNRQQKQITIDTNIVTNTGKLVGNGIFPTNENLNAIVEETDTTRANNFVYIRRNVVRSTGYMAIKFHGTNVRASQNISDSFCMNIDDGGGIYSFTKNDGTYTGINYSNRVIDSNFISNCIGAFAGTTRSTPDARGYYMDDQVGFVTGYHNSISNIPGNGAEFNNPQSMVFTDNTVYNCDYPIEIQIKQYGVLSNNSITRNVLYQKTSSQFNFIHNHSNLSQPPPTVTINQSLQNMAFIDTNWITNIKNTGYSYNSNGGSGQTNLVTWQGTILHDLVSVLPPTVVNNTNTNYYTNPTDTVRVIRFSTFSKVDPKGMVYNNIAAVPQWSSLVLIDNGNAPPINQFPIANAGADTTITSPASTANLNGSASYDPDGTIILYNWIQLSGQNASTITSAGSAITTVSGLIPGIYQYQLTVTDNNSATATSIVRVTVNVPPNLPPTANAGVDQQKILPVNTATLSGSGNDPDGSITAYHWDKISGPSGGSITTPNSANTGITALQQGTYVFQLTVTDNGGLTGSDIMNVTVYPENIAPSANAGDDQTTTLPANSVTLTGSGTDPDGSIVSFLWAKISGPSGGDIESPSSAITDINNLQEGTYVYKLTVTDNMGATGIDFVQVIVYPPIPPPNAPPFAFAGNDTIIILPHNTALLNGIGIDTDGVITAYYWSQLSGPSVAGISSPNTASTGITSMIQGAYIFQLRVTDNSGDTATDAIQVTIAPANLLPTVSAGPNQIITLPIDSTTITAVASDPDGTIASIGWSKISGPSGGTIDSPTELSTHISNMIEGFYLYRIKVVDNSGDSAVSTVQITVNPVPIITKPTANVGDDQIIFLPDSTAIITGSGTNGTGTIVSHVWSLFDGPGGGDIATPNNYTTSVNNLQEGTYIYKLTVTDNNGLIGTGLMQIVVRQVPALRAILLRGVYP